MNSFGEGELLSGRYRLQRMIERGDTRLWVALDERLGRRVAVEIAGSPAPPSRRDVTTGPPSPARAMLPDFEQEARAVAKVRSVHLVRIYDHGSDRGVAYLVTELLEGEDLRARLEREGQLPLGDVAELVEQLAKGLEQIHAARLIHGNLRPANVFLSSIDGEEVVKIIGLRAVSSARADSCRTQGGALLGAARYLSPESLAGTGARDPLCDLWALAVIAYRSLTGRPPFSGASLRELTANLRRGAFPAPSKLVPELPRDVDAFFERALAPDPGARFGSARQIAAAFSVFRCPDSASPFVPPSIWSASDRPPGAPRQIEANLEITAPRSRRSIAAGAIDESERTIRAPVSAVLLELTRAPAPPPRAAAPRRSRVSARAAAALVVLALSAVLGVCVALGWLAAPKFRITARGGVEASAVAPVPASRVNVPAPFGSMVCQSGPSVPAAATQTSRPPQALRGSAGLF